MNEEKYQLESGLVPQIDPLPLVPQPVFTITEKAPTRAFSWLKEPTRAFTFKTLLRHYVDTGVDPTVSRREIGTPRQLS